MAATLQRLSGGRLVLGIGAGWKEDEYRAYGYPYPSAGTRIAQLREAVTIIRALWRDAPVTFRGEHYRVEGAYCEPRPDPAPPILIGGKGERQTLRVVAELADWWNGTFLDPDAYRAKVAVLHRHCAEVGRDPGDIVLTVYGHVAVDRDPIRAERVDPIRPEIYRHAGTPEEVAAELNRFIALGVKHLMLKFADFPRLDGYDLFMDEVVPRLHLGG
jgi:alkanesulfonate monooxygenase SsuD/methylene tetrahydromethanopterin reductase-like flavin-dependent oxidoreductase (luciferase family)